MEMAVGTKSIHVRMPIDLLNRFDSVTSLADKTVYLKPDLSGFLKDAFKEKLEKVEKKLPSRGKTKA